MRPVTLNLGGIKDPQVLAALMEIQRASQDTLQNDTSSSGSAMATLTGAAADQIAYFTSQFTTAFAALTAFGRSLIGQTSASIATGGPLTVNFNGSPLQPFTFAVPTLTLSGQLPAPTDGETILLFDTYGVNANGTIVFSKVEGTTAAPTKTLNQDVLGLIASIGWGTTGRTTTGAAIHFRAEEDYTDTVWGTSIGFFTAPVGGGAAAVAERMRIGPAGVTFGGTDDILSAFTAYTPTVTANVGAFTTVSATGRYKKIGKIVFVQIKVIDTTNGSAAGFVIATLPFAPVLTQSFALCGFEGNTGFTVAGNISTASGGVANIFKYDGTFPLSSGDSLWVSGYYEAA